MMNLCFAPSSFTPLARPLVVRHDAGSACARAPAVVMSMRGSGRSWGWGPRRHSKSFGGSGGAGGGGMGGAGGDGAAGGGATGGSSSGGSSSDKPSSNNPLMMFWRAYNASLEANPILTKALTSFVGFSLGDILAQKFLGDKGAAVDLWRVMRMAAFGFLFHGPTGHYFYGFLDKLMPGAAPLTVGTKVFIDQVMWAPIFTVFFFAFLGAAERKSPQDIADKIKADTWNGVTASWKFWPLAHVINFAFVPTQQRLLYINTLQVGYNMILSVLGNRDAPAKPVEASE